MPVFFIEPSFVFLVAALSVLCGLGTYLQGRREGRLSGFLDLFAEITLAVIVGLTVAYIGETQNIAKGYTCAAVLILSNNGSDTINAIRSELIKRLSVVMTTGGKK